MILLIPAYQPDAQLPELVRAAVAADPDWRVVVVDDGSGPAYSSIFDQARSAGAQVLSYRTNRGKGFALKAGITLILSNHPDQDVVCADCDGQHSVDDIRAVAAKVETSGGAVVLGVREFSGAVPLRSRVGNVVSRQLFRLSTGRVLSDTQTGLRGYPAALLPWVRSVGGDRYEFEFNLLLEAGQAGCVIETVGISTIYLAANESSHFRPLQDSIRIYAPLLKFVSSSLGAFAIDAVAVVLLNALTGSLLTAVVGARVLSSSANFLINREAVFAHGRDRPLLSAALGYFALAAGLLGVNYLLLWTLTTAGLPLLPAKIATDLALFLLSYAVQTRVLFGRDRAGRGGRVAAGPALPASMTAMPTAASVTAMPTEAGVSDPPSRTSSVGQVVR